MINVSYIHTEYGAQWNGGVDPTGAHPDGFVIGHHYDCGTWDDWAQFAEGALPGQYVYEDRATGEWFKERL